MTGAAPRAVRLVVLVCLALVSTAAAPALAEGSTGRSDEAAARRLLERAADASRSVGYAGTQYVASWSGSASTSTLVEVAHDPVQGTVVTRPSSAGPSYDPADVVAPDGGPVGLEGRVLDVLADHYALRVAGRGTCAGRSADIVEARRPGTRGEGAVAGRFWLDHDSGLVLRREVYDTSGRAISSSAFLDLALVPTTGSAPSPPVQEGEDGSDPGRDEAVLEQMRRDGWKAPDALPGGFSLFEARLRDDDRRVQLSYTDGLSTLSLFAQRGEIGEGPGGAFRRSSLDGARVWTSSSVPQRVVWSGGGQVWTLVSDAPADAVLEAVVALPHDPAPDDGVMARLGRGLRRMGGMLNPFG